MHICRIYKPDIVYLYLSKEMCEFQEKDDRYRYCLEQLGKKLDKHFEIIEIQKNELEEVQVFDTFMKEYREVLQFGIFYRLKSPFEGNETVWMVTNEDRTLAIVGYYRVLNGVNQPYSRVRLQGLNPDMVYENVWNHTENYGDELMNYGLITSDVTAGEVPGNVTPCTDFESRIYMLKGKKVQEGR